LQQEGKKSDEIKIQGIIYTKYKDIPDSKWNRESASWEPDHEKKLKKKNSLKTVMEIVKEIFFFRPVQSDGPLMNLAWNLAKSAWMPGQKCAMCESTDRVEMHHVKAVRNINRRQIPLCRSCHQNAHGEHDKNHAGIKNLS
jgi:hypothetical protein